MTVRSHLLSLALLAGLFSVPAMAYEEPKDLSQDAAWANQQQMALSGRHSGTGWNVTESGLRWRLLAGTGEGQHPEASDEVAVHYEGALVDGTVFDSSIQRGQPAVFPLNRVIAGWTEGLQLMGVGDEAEFAIPAELGYGARNVGPIPANSTLIFKVQLLAIKPK